MRCAERCPYWKSQLTVASRNDANKLLARKKGIEEFFEGVYQRSRSVG